MKPALISVKFLPIGIGILLILLGISAWVVNRKTMPVNNTSIISPATEVTLHNRQTRPANIGTTPLTVYIAETPSEQEQGLSNVVLLGTNEGMLFLFSQKNIPQFWMKDMQFNLDFIWIADNKVVDIIENVPKPTPNTPLQALPLYSPKVPVSAVIEVNAGFIQQHNIKLGDLVTY